MKNKENKALLDKATEILKDDDGFLILEPEMTAKEWHNKCSYFLRKIPAHECDMKHIVREFGIVNQDFAGIKLYKKIWICENCFKVFLKSKYDPEELKMKELYQAAFYAADSSLVKMMIEDQIKDLQA
jgi:hypothetical protein